MKDTWTDNSKVVSRLLDVYEKHGNIIVATDFDDTVFGYTEADSVHDKAIELLQRCSKLGLPITVQTCSRTDRFDYITEFLADRNIEILGINTQPEGIPYGGTGKSYYNIILDDRAGLGQAIDILEEFLDFIENK